VPGVMKIVLDGSGEVRVAGAGAGNRFALILGAVEILDGEDFSPVLPVLVANDDSDGGADGAGVAHAGDDLGAVGLDFHAATAAKALLAAPELAVDGVDRYGYAGRQ